MNAIETSSPIEMEDILKGMKNQHGKSLWDLSQNQSVLLVFLRHFGCTFCREALADIAERKEEIEKSGIKIVFVHMSENKLAERYFNRYELSGVDHVSDESCQYYIHFGLTKGNFTQLFGLKSWTRGFQAGVVKGHFVGNQLGDGFQMPGVFVVTKGKIQNSFIHKVVSDRPDYEALVKCCVV